MDLKTEIEKFGLKEVAGKLKTNPEKLIEKIESPRLFTLGDMVILKGQFGIAYEDIINILNKS